MKAHKFQGAQVPSCGNFGALAKGLAALLLIISTAHAQIGNDNPTGPCGQFNGNVTTGCSYDPYTANATRSVTDITVTGGTGAYPLAFTRTMTSRYITGLLTEFGPAGSWRHSYQWSIKTETTNGGRPGRYVVNYPDGRQITFSNTGSGDPDWRGQPGVRDRFEHLTAADQVNCKLVLPDGGKIWFQAYHPNNNANKWAFTLHAIVDPYGQTTSIWYGTWNNQPIMTIQEPVQGPTARWLHILYRTITDTSQGHYGDVVVDRVEASDGRTVSYGYQAYVTPNGTRYTSLHQVRHFGNQWWDSFYSYQNSNAPDSNGRPLIKTCVDPLFDGPMWMIAYSFAGTSVYGKLQSEKYYDWQNIGAAVSTISNPSQYVRTETRGDTRQRTFTYNGNNNSPTYGLWKVTDFNGIDAKQTYSSSTGFLATATDRENNTTTYECKWKGGAISKITSATPGNVIPPGTPTVIDYRYAGDGGCSDPNNNDPDNPYYVCKVNNGPSYERFPSKQIKKITYPPTPAGTPTEEFTYNQYGQVLTHKMRNGYTESWIYDPNNPSRVSEYRDGEHQNTGHPTAWYQYNSLGRVSGITDGNGASSGDPAHTTTFLYNPPGQLIRITHPDGTYIQYFYWANRALMATTDERHPTTSDPDQATVYFQDNYKRLRAVITPKRSGNDPLPRTTTYYYDQNGVGDDDYTRTADVPTKIVSPGGKIIRTTYDNNLRARTVRIVGDSNVPDAVTTYGYDNNGSVHTVQDPRNNITTYDYDALDRVKGIIDPIPADRDGDGYTMYFWYDPSGNLKKQKRADGKTCIFEYDLMGFMKDRWGYQNEHTHYVPDLAGNLSDYKFEQANGQWIVYHYHYDKVNRLHKVTYPADWLGHSRYEQYDYDIANHLWQYRNPNGDVKTLSYDNRGRLTNASWSANGPSVIIVPDAASRPQSIISSESGVTATVAFGYDEANNRIYEDQTVGNITRRVQTDPDADGNRTNLLVKSGTNFNTTNFANYFDYTSRNELLNIYDSNNAAFFKYFYDAAGNVTKRQGQRSTDGRTEMPTYDALNRPQHCNQYYHNGTQFDTIDYYYSKLGNLNHTVRGDYGGGKGDWFGYDDLNQVGTAVYKATGLDAPDTPAKRVTYTCGNRNRLGMAVDDYDNNQHYTMSYTPVDLNQYTTIGIQGGTLGIADQFFPDTNLPLTWDNNFNLKTFYGWTYTYDAENRLISVSVSGGGHSASLYYDGLGRCVKRAIDNGTTILTYDQWTPIGEWDGNGNLLAYNVFGLGDDEILYRHQFSPTDKEYYYRSDAMGNVKFILDGNGTGVEKYDYDAFGKAWITDFDGTHGRWVSHCGNRFMFSGREYFSELAALGLYDMRNRVYDPFMGRFYQTDPIGLQGDPLNLYRFCGHNPLQGGDPMGLQEGDQPSSGTISFTIDFSGPTSWFDGSSPAAIFGSENWWGDSIFGLSTPSSYYSDTPIFVEGLGGAAGPVSVSRTAALGRVNAASGTSAPISGLWRFADQAVRWISDAISRLGDELGVNQTDLEAAAAMSVTGPVIKTGVALEEVVAGLRLFPARAAAAKSATQRVFWSGGRPAENAAKIFASNNRGLTIADTAAGRALAEAGGAWSQTRPQWVDLSREFARGASGEVNVFHNARGLSLDSMWREEFKILNSNPNVTKINFHVVMPDGSIVTLP
jgi:RHS repeat-associated protein